MDKEDKSSPATKNIYLFQSNSKKDVIRCNYYTQEKSLHQSNIQTYQSIPPHSKNHFIQNLHLIKRKSVSAVKSNILSYNEKEQNNIEKREKKLKLAKECYNRHHKNNFQKQKSKIKMEFIETLLDDSFIKKYADGDDTNFYYILQILTKPYNNRNKNDNEKLLNFLLRTKIQEKLKTDCLISNLSIQKLYKYMMPYISSKIYDFNDTIYYEGEESDNIYIILDGNVTVYKIEKSEEILSCEEYYLYLSDNYLAYKKQLKISHENKNENFLNEFIDEFLIYQIVEENKELYPLYSLDDLNKMREIIFKINLYKFLLEKKASKIQELFHDYHYSYDHLKYNEIIESKIPLSRYMQLLSKSFKKNELFYRKISSPLKHKVKLMKFVKVENLGKYDYFGNFELINYSPFREETVRCNSKKCLLLSINKNLYGYDLYLKQKKIREKDLENFNKDYLFKDTTKFNFEQKVYSHFQINNFFKGQRIFNQNEPIKDFIFIKEGILEISLQNYSFNDLNDKITELWNFLNKKAKEFKINIKEFLDFDLILYIDDKKKQKYKEVLNRKQNFILSHSEKGFYGGYETFFSMNSLVTGTVVSEQCRIYTYNFEKYKDSNEASFRINENLKNCSLDILKNILKRMITVYNSYWKLKDDHLHLENIEKENEIEEIKNYEKKRSRSNSKKIKNLFATIKINELAKELTNKPNNLNNNENENTINNKFNNNTLSKSVFTKKDPRNSMQHNFNSTRNVNYYKNIFNTKTYYSNMHNDVSLKQKNSANINNNKYIENNVLTERYNKKNLLRNFKFAMDAQHAKHKKEHKKVFCPPILAIPQKALAYKIFNDEKEDNDFDYNFHFSKTTYNKIKNKKIEVKMDNNMYKSENENKKNFNLLQIEKEFQNQIFSMTARKKVISNKIKENKTNFDIKNARLKIIQLRRKKSLSMDKKLQSETYNFKSIRNTKFKGI